MYEKYQNDQSFTFGCFYSFYLQSLSQKQHEYAFFEHFSIKRNVQY